jgi:hypothetical protein
MKKKGNLTSHYGGINRSGYVIPISIKDLSDEINGCLADWKFPVARLFTVAGVRAGEKRGGHAHKTNSQILICLQGNINVITIDYIKFQENYDSHMLSQGSWLYHPRLQWADLEFITEGSILLSLCSDEYDKDDYLHTRAEWTSYIESEYPDCYG